MSHHRCKDNCKCYKRKKRCSSNLYECFTGFFGPRKEQILDDPSNSKTFFLTLEKSNKVIFKLTHDNPSAVMNLFVYDENSYFSTQVAPHQGADIEDPLATTYFSDVTGNNPSVVKICQQLMPGRYAVRVVLVEGEGWTDYKLKVKANNICTCNEKKKKQSTNPFVGFWQSEEKGVIRNVWIQERCNGDLYIVTYLNHPAVGYQNRALFRDEENFSVVLDLELVTEGVYRFRPAEAEEFDTFRYVTISQDNKDQLIWNLGGGANRVALGFFPTILTRDPTFKNNIVDFNDTTNTTSPVQQLDQFVNELLLANNVQVNKYTETVDFPGYNEMLAIQDKILQTGITTEFTGRDVWPEQTVFNFTTELDPNPITTYAPTTLINSRLIIAPTDVIYFDPNTDYEVGLTVKITGVLNANDIGIPNEWVNTYYLVTAIVDDFITLTPLRLEERYPIIEPSVTLKVPSFTVTPYTFKLQNPIVFRFPGEFSSGTSFILRLSGLESVGGLDASYLNGRHVVAWSDPNAMEGESPPMFIQIPPGDGTDDIFATTSEVGGGNNGVFEVSTYPNRADILRLYNFNSLHLNATPMTTIFTDQPTLATLYTQIELSGFAGEYSKLNGVWPVHWFSQFTSNITEEIWGNKFYMPNRKYYTQVEVDSAGLPSFDSTVHTENGLNYHVKHIVRRVTNDSDYGTFGGALAYLTNIMGVDTHGRLEIYYDSIKGLYNPSWDLIQESLSVNFVSTYSLQARAFDRTATSPYLGYNAAFGSKLNELNSSAHNNTPGAPINSNLRFDPSSPSVLTGEDLKMKYLDTESLREIYATISGPVLNERVPGSDPCNLNISNDLINLGANANGTILNYETLPVGEYIALGLNVEMPEDIAGRYELVNGFAFNGFVPKDLGNKEIILANPPDGMSPLQNDVTGKIVMMTIFGTFGVKYDNAVNAGAAAVIFFWPGSDTAFSNGTIGRTIVPETAPPLYTMAGINAGDVVTGWNGESSNDPNNYDMPTTSPTGYNGSLGQPLPPLRKLLVGDDLYFGKIKEEFSEGKNIGFVSFQNSLPVTSLGIDLLTEFRDVYRSEASPSNPPTSRLDVFAKLWRTMMETEIAGTRMSDMDVILIDNGNNFGGFSDSWYALASFFGTNRLNLERWTVYADNGNSFPISQQELVDKFPPNFPILLQAPPPNVECAKYQGLYPDAAFKKSKVVHLTSTISFSAGDVYVHPWRNHEGPDYSDIGGGVKSVLIGTCDGRLHGAAPVVFSQNLITQDVPFKIAPSVNGVNVPVKSYEYGGETASTFIDAYSKKFITNQLDYTQIDGLNGTGPIAAWNEDEAGLYQAFGFSSNYDRGDEPQYAIFNNVIGLPVPFNPATYHYPWLEDAILECLNP